MSAASPFVLHILIFGSGLAGLGYEMVWTRMLAGSLGHEIASVLAVVSAFFGGLALGSWLLDGPIRRSTRPALWYAGLEALIGLWGLVLLWLLPAGGPWIARWIGVDPTPLWHWTVSFAAPFVVLLPATTAMGATLPAVERLSALTLGRSNAVGGLYAANTFGAVAGVVVTTFVWVPRWGYGATGLLLAACNLACAVGALALSRQKGPATPRQGRSSSAPSVLSPVRLALSLFATGLLGIGYEVVVVRVSSQILENTVYSFATVLAVFLLGSAGGAALYQRWTPCVECRRTLTRLLVATSMGCLLGIFALWNAKSLYVWVRDSVGLHLLGALTAELAVATGVLLLPTLLMGATFTHLALAATRTGFGLGRALAVNTLGGALAPAIFGVVLLPAIGSPSTLILAAIGYLLLVPGVSRSRNWVSLAVPAALAAVALVTLGPRDLVDLGPGERVLVHAEGVMGAVTVIEDERRDRHLSVNGRFQMGGTSTVYSDHREAHIPLLLHPAPQSALFLGAGTGVTLAGATRHPGLKVDGVELVPEIVDLMGYFAPADLAQTDEGGPRVHVADARRFIQASRVTYDVIVADLFHPSRDGSGSLYTLEHFQAIRSRLAEGGLFMQWLPLYQLDLKTLRTIVRTYLQAFPDARAFLAHYSLKAPIVGLVGGGGSRRYPAEYLARRVQDPPLQRELVALRLGTDFELFGGLLGDATSLAAFAGDAPINTDDRPVVAFRAPYFAYGHPEPADQRLLVLLDALSAAPGSIYGMAAEGATGAAASRLAAYFEARDRFILAGVGVQQTDDVQRLDSELREPLLAVVRASPDFSAAYNPLLSMALRLSRIDPVSADKLLHDLERANPRRPEASQLRRRLGLE
jgi:spermidine synthase